MKNILLILICLELLWCMYIETKKILFEQHIAHPVILERKIKVFQNIIKYTKDPIAFVRGWFYNIDFENITYEDVSEWLSWGFFENKYPDTLENADKLFLTYMVDNIGKLCNRKFPKRTQSTHSPNKFLAYSIEPYECGYSTLFIYIATMCIFPMLTSLYLSYLGFTKQKINGINFWILNKNSDTIPIVLLHGLGVGILPYCQFSNSLISLDTTIIIPDMTFFSIYINDNIPDDNLLVLAIKKAIESVNKSAIIIGHSYGTAVMSWIIQAYPHIVASVVLLDPFVLMLHLPDTVINFLYKKREYNTLGILQSDPYINWVLRRHFWWVSSILWLEDIENIPAVVVLCMKDQILPAQAIKEYIEGHDTPPLLLRFDEFQHGEFLSNQTAIDEIISAIHQIQNIKWCHNSLTPAN